MFLPLLRSFTAVACSLSLRQTKEKAPVILPDLLTIETVRASLIFSSHPGDGPIHHLLYIGDFRQQGEHGEVEIQSLGNWQ